MYENFKEKVKTHQNKIDKISKTELPSKTITKLKHQGTDSGKVTLRQLFHEELYSDGQDLSLMSGAEGELMIKYAETRRYLLEKYPNTKQETKLRDNVWVEDPNAPGQIDQIKAKADSKLLLLSELILKMTVIFNKIHVLQSKALDYEKICLRFYSYLTYNWNHAKDIEKFRELYWSDKKDIFEIVENYFKICKKYQVPIFEEPYYFLTNQQQMEIKLEGDEMRRNGQYNDFEINISILENTQ
jgi:hypothetical protein